MLSIQRTWTEVDLETARSNYRICEAYLQPGCEAMAVVKADGYGHGDKELSAVYQECGCRHFAVSNANEAQNLREAGIKGSILILGYTPLDQIRFLYDNDIIQAIPSEEYAMRLASAGIPVKCAWAVDTGMNRIGIDGDSPKYCEIVIRQFSGSLNTVGIFTHLCAADSEKEEDREFTLKQIAKFEELAEGLKDMKLPYVHCLNSAGSMNYECRSANIQRLGIILYGLKPDRDAAIPSGLRPVMTWKTIVTMVKTVSPGEDIGYGRTYRCTGERRIATIPVGYADGYPRSLSNKGFVLVGGRKAPIVGNICMDQMMIDVTDIDNVNVDDEVILLGRSGDEEITADDVAEIAGTIGYEIVCGITKRVERRYINNRGGYGKS